MKIISHYTDNPALREKLYVLTNTVFPSADFQCAFEVGGWGKTYHPVSILEDDRIVANVAYCEMEAIVQGQRMPSIQFATVATHPEYRKRGYARLLMDKIIAEQAPRTEFMFLYANENVLEFYPKFGFERLYEWRFHAEISGIVPQPKGHALDVFDSVDLSIIQGLAATRLPITEVFGATNYGFAFLFHLANGMNSSLHYLPERNVLVSCKQEGTTMHIFDVLSDHPFSFREILPEILPNSNMKEVLFHFTPELIDLPSKPKTKILDDELFVRGNFPLHGQQFKFPAMAQT